MVAWARWIPSGSLSDRRCDFLDQGRHRLWVDSVRGDLEVESWLLTGEVDDRGSRGRVQRLDQGRPPRIDVTTASGISSPSHHRIGIDARSQKAR
jgi:hypothetical protein